MTALRRLLAALLALGAWVLPAAAHQASDSTLSIRVGDGANAIAGQWDIALRDLDAVIGLDTDGDGKVSPAEWRARQAAIAAYALAHLAIKGDGADCPLRAGAQRLVQHGDGTYTALPLRIACAGEPHRLSLSYTLLADTDPQHRGLLRLEAPGVTRTAVFGPAAATQDFTVAAPGRWRQFLDYLDEGIWHIWAGYDHILFLLSLLLPAVLVWQGSRWAVTDSFRVALVQVLKIVTAFTVAHSITLSLATLGVIALPSRWVESAIALSVALAALNNVWPLVHGRLWTVAFGFGLIHGFGFASVLADLGLPRGALALALAGFNLGVEVGQVAIVALFLPLAFALRDTAFYRRGLFVPGSLTIAMIAALWFGERLFDFRLLPA